MDSVNEPGQVIVHPGCRSPFAGITINQARIVNSALGGLPVEVYVPHSRHCYPTQRYVFGHIVLPGWWPSDPFQEVGDVVLIHTDSDLRPRWGLARVLSAGMIARLKVLAMNGCRKCETCGAVLLRTDKVYDTGWLGNEWAQRFECAGCWDS